ncbi:phosphodiester glycosidase family protein [Suttonella ornithocola]|uniref:Exopolysaccharide biosynthesis protein related to N-acetylglucosamine-1-phosphodiester alpha-N-acetylglucosaminidase n=1 Tax=Suttonella ornithocola TaxID=279832 RepID=A0A380MX63_9GAMM|nr:phosphodiester glycosidase family protein [Suttonella ornithocola]SUO97149.1 Exopolysaccharide biosynthesis protein related to N-acetylglucosamine-1-phosphodiester alpha-N-acetylglucosaminidase [Suttonella ornithocola]
MNKWLLFLSVFLSACISARNTDFQEVFGGTFAQKWYKGVEYSIFQTAPINVRLIWQDEKGKNYAHLSTALFALESNGFQVAMIMNAGIYNTNYMPAGLWIEKGKTLRTLNTEKGKGNFHIQPNGIFWIKQNKVGITSTEKWKKSTISAEYAVQSGPMLLINGEINPRFVKNLHSPYKRNAVCVTRNHSLYFIMTTTYRTEWPSFYQLAEALKHFGCYQALYLDGSISEYYMPNISRGFHWKPFVGMIAVAFKKQEGK